VNVPVLEACAVVGVIAEVGVTVVVIAREVTVRAEEASAKAVVPIVVAVKVVVSIVVAVKVVASIIGTAAKAGTARFGPTEAAQMRTSEPSHGAAAGMFATKSTAHFAATTAASKSSAHVATAATASKSSAHVATATTATKSSASSVTAATTASKSSASSMTAAAAAAATANRPAGQGVRPRRCTERDGDEEDHDLACDWLLLDAGR
jgi:hypothetical protein